MSKKFRCYLLIGFVVGEAFGGPVGREVVWKEEDADFFEAEVLECFKRGADVWAVVHRAATAIDNEACGARKSRGPRGEFFQAFRVAGCAVIDRALDVARGIETLEADENYGGRRLRVFEFFGEIRRLDG